MIMSINRFGEENRESVVPDLAIGSVLDLNVFYMRVSMCYTQEHSCVDSTAHNLTTQLKSSHWD